MRKRDSGEQRDKMEQKAGNRVKLCAAILGAVILGTACARSDRGTGTETAKSQQTAQSQQTQSQQTAQGRQTQNRQTAQGQGEVPDQSENGVGEVPNQTEAGAADQTAAQITVVDAGGNEVRLPSEINRIVVCCYGGVTHELTALGVQDKIVAQPDMGKFPTLAKMYPEFKDLPFAGSFNNVNIEEILTLEPDIVINSVSSDQGNEALKKAGIPVLEALTGKGNIDKLKHEFMVMGTAFGKQDTAQKLVSYWNEKLDQIHSRVDKVQDKKTVYYMLGSRTHTNGSGWWGDDFITTAGGINVAADLKDGRDTSLEQVVKWNPDVIILSENEGSYMSVESILEDPQLKGVKAIQNKEVYECPIGTFWWDRPSPESILGFLWLADMLYPKECADLDLQKETVGFYKMFFNYDLSAEEYEQFIHPVK